MAAIKAWTITASGERAISEIARDLAAAGLRDATILDAIGVICGSADEEAVGKLRQVAGVTDVSPDIPVNLGPPDADETW